MTDQRYKIIQGDNLTAMREMPDNSVDSIVTDPPYGLSFMGKKWDYDVPSIETWRECLRVLKPGGHLLAFAGTRTQHRMAVRIEDAGFEIRDMIAWVYGTGFPKSHNVSKAIDKAAGAEREVIGFDAEKAKKQTASTASVPYGGNGNSGAITAPATESAKQWEGWGTALKPALEPITVARKPLFGTVADNVLRHGTGAINVDGCRVPADGVNLGRLNNARATGTSYVVQKNTALINNSGDKGRFPANLIHDGSEEVLALFPVTSSGGLSGKRSSRRSGNVYAGAWGDKIDTGFHSSTGSAARYFYCAKASKRDRDEGLAGSRNVHPTVKPTQLMRYLCRLVTPPGGVVLDPFCGSGSTGKAAVLEGFRFIGLELDPAYVEIAEARCEWAASNPDTPQTTAEDPPTPSVKSEPAEPDRCQLKLFVK